MFHAEQIYFHPATLVNKGFLKLLENNSRHWRKKCQCKHMTDTKTITYTLKQKNQFQFQIKSGSKVLEKICSAGGGWHSACHIWDTVDQAVENFITSREDFCSAMGQEIKIEIVRK
jgi:hypothetical protein